MQNCVYELNGGIYINLTNACSNSCDFCVRNFKDGMGGSGLWLEHDPSAKEVEEELGRYDLSAYGSAVFCGFGEPTCAFDVLIEVAGWLKERGVKTRVNTNGQANLINGITDAARRMAPVIDCVSVSLNASTAEKYQAVCHSVYEKEVEACRKVAESVGAEFRVRPEIKEGSED